MKKLEYTVSFTTPAFLGNAEQQAQWRTPPFKALIRQWWRVATASSVSYDVGDLRSNEAELFGSASDTEGSQSGQSHLVIRLTSWKHGVMDQWQAGDRVFHPEVGNGGRDVGADLYLGYGPLTFAKGTAFATVKGTDIQRTAINCKTDFCRLILGAPDEHFTAIQKTMELIEAFGTLGSRSRNGWGSLKVRGADSQTPPAPLNRSMLDQLSVTRRLPDCLTLEWPHAIGTDEKGPLVWRTKIQNTDWRLIIKELARIKVAFRTQFAFSSGGPSPSRRHVLAYPVTNHVVGGWGQQARLGNQLRFKVAEHQNGKLEGIIVHLPCKMPDELVNKLSQPSDRQFVRTNEPTVWRAVHKVLDKEAVRLS